MSCRYESDAAGLSRLNTPPTVRRHLLEAALDKNDRITDLTRISLKGSVLILFEVMCRSVAQLLF